MNLNLNVTVVSATVAKDATLEIATDRAEDVDDLLEKIDGKQTDPPEIRKPDYVVFNRSWLEHIVKLEDEIEEG
jgi:hypothetical protein